MVTQFCPEYRTQFFLFIHRPPHVRYSIWLAWKELR
jgi:hypothetical protein